MPEPRAEVRIRGMWPQDWPAVARIYEGGLAQGTLETRVPDRASFEAARPEPLRLVAVEGAGPGPQRVLGWVAATRVSARPVYAGVVEHSVYVDPDARGRGVGRLLLEAFVAATELHGVWSIRSGLFPENAASRALHARCGFREVGTYERPGRREGVWRDVVLIERRSRTVGVDGAPLIRLPLPGELPDEGPDQRPGEGPAGRRTWVAESASGVVAGRATLDRTGTAEAPGYELRELVVDPGHPGLGARLLETVLAAAALDSPGPAPVRLPGLLPDGLDGAGPVRIVGA